MGWDKQFPHERIFRTVDFTAALGKNAVIASIDVLTVTCKTGIDSNPQALVDGEATLDTTAKFVTFAVSGGVSGAVYEITVEVTCSNGEKLVSINLLAVV